MNIKDYENVLWNSIKDDLKAMVNIAERKPKTTQDHYVNFKNKGERNRHMYSPRRSRSRAAPVAIQGGKHEK